ncbi:hypothetical protein Tco_0526613 [Tanacetum coccineum]
MLNMRHRRWIELLSNYDCELKYHPGKANALSKKERSPLCWLEARDMQLTRLDIIQETVDKITSIKERLKTAWSFQKRYGDNHRKPLEFKSKIMYPVKGHDSL